MGYPIMDAVLSAKLKGETADGFTYIYKLPVAVVLPRLTPAAK